MVQSKGITDGLESLSGQWRCRWIMGNQHGLEELHLDFQNGKIHGSGFDPDGPFDYAGQYVVKESDPLMLEKGKASLEIVLTKTYRGRTATEANALSYSGYWDGSSIFGWWAFLPSLDFNPQRFQMWPGTLNQPPVNYLGDLVLDPNQPQSPADPTATHSEVDQEKGLRPYPNQKAMEACLKAHPGLTEEEFKEMADFYGF